MKLTPQACVTSRQHLWLSAVEACKHMCVYGRLQMPHSSPCCFETAA
jgi:hypothetical protein